MSPEYRTTETEKDIVLCTPHLEIGFSKKNGALTLLRPAGADESWIGHGDPIATLDARLGTHWQGAAHAARFLAHAVEKMPDGVRLTISTALGSLRLHDVYTISGPLIERRVVVENASDGEMQLNGVRLIVPWVCLGEVDECRFEAPGTAVRPRLSLAVAARERLGRTPDDQFAPAAPARWGLSMEDAPDCTPGLLAMHHAARGETLLCWYSSEVEAGTPRVDGNDTALSLIHEPILAGWLTPGQSLAGGSQFILLHHGSWDEALSAFRTYYQRVGILPPLYGQPPAWVREAAIYEVHPGQFGGFRGLAEALPRLRKMGINTLYLMPIWAYDNRNGQIWDGNWTGGGSPYAMRDFERFEPTLGTSEDFRYLVGEAHRLGMRLLLDFVAQGCARDARYVSEHPEWFCRDEAGNLVSSHGWIDTYSFDWANPDYHEYMLDWSLRLLREYGFDGYRVDAPHGKEPNWDRRIPYHASATNLGVLRLLERLQAGVKAINPEAVLLCELFGPIFVKSHDMAYDYLPCVQTYQLLQQRLTPWEWGEWVRDHFASLPEGAVRVCFMETHDTRDFQPPAYGWRGSQLSRAGFAALLLAGFVPMIWSGQERGHEDFYRRLLRARRESAALLRGETLFNAVPCDNEWVLSVIRRHGNEVVWGVISLWPEKRTHHFEFPVADLELDLQAYYRLHDLIGGRVGRVANLTHWSEYGQTVWTGEELANCVLTPEPFVPYFWRVAS